MSINSQAKGLLPGSTPGCKGPHALSNSVVLKIRGGVNINFTLKRPVDKFAFFLQIWKYLKKIAGSALLIVYHVYGAAVLNLPRAPKIYQPALMAGV